MEDITSTSTGENNNQDAQDGDRDRRLAQVAGQTAHDIKGAIDHGFVAGIVEKHVDKERADEIVEALKRIDQIEQTETIVMKAARGELQPREVVVRDALATQYGICCDLMTPEEAAGLYDWASDSTEIIKDQKAEILIDVTEQTINGKYVRRDSGKFRRLLELSDKGADWQAGLIDTSVPFDTSRFSRKSDEHLGSWHGADYNYANYDEEALEAETYTHSYGDDYERYSRDLIDLYKDGEIDADELADALNVSREEFYVYGPFTEGEMDDLSELTWPVYTSPTNWRLRSPVGRLVESSIPPRTDDIYASLNHCYIGENILPNRRLSARDLVTVVASVGIDAQELLQQVKGKKNEDHRELRKCLGWCSFYLAKICRITPGKVEGVDENKSQGQRLKARYGLTRPIAVEFYQEALDRAERWTDWEARETDENFNAYLLKMEEWAYKAEAILSKLTKAEDSDYGGQENGIEVPDVFALIGKDDNPQLPPAEGE